MPGQTRQVRNWLLVLSLSGFVLFLVVGVISLIAYFQLTDAEAVTYGWREPLDAVSLARVRPDLALLPLGGVSVDDAVREALAAGEPDSAFAIVVYASDLNAAVRGGLLALVGDRYVQARRPAEAALCFQLAHDLAALSPDLADVARFDLSLAAARGRLALGDEAGLTLSLEQARTIVRYSAFLQPVQRRRAVDQLARMVAAARGERAASRLQAEMADVLTLRPSSPLFPSPTRREPLPPNPTLEAVRQERQQKALALIDQWIALGGGDVGPEISDLAEFLRREDEARIAWYMELSQRPDLTLPQQASLLADQAAWLLVKLQTARRAFGVSLVPAWEARELEIRQALAATQLALFAKMREQNAQFVNQREVDLAAWEIVRQELATWRWGHYPGLNWEERERALLNANRTVWQHLVSGGVTPGSGVFPMPWTTDDHHGYLLVNGGQIAGG